MGCGCNANFSGQKKQCTCGRNAGGMCQCNNRKLNAAGDGIKKLRSYKYPVIGETYGVRQGRKPQQNLQQRIKSNKARFSSFMGYSNKFPKVDTKKYGISDEHYFEFNSRVGHTAGINRTDMQEMDF